MLDSRVEACCEQLLRMKDASSLPAEDPEVLGDALCALGRERYESLMRRLRRGKASHVSPRISAHAHSRHRVVGTWCELTPAE